MKNIQKGFSIPAIITVMLILTIGGGSFVYLENKKADVKTLAQTSSAESITGTTTPEIKKVSTTKEKDTVTTITKATTTVSVRDEIKASITVDLNTKNPSIVTGTYYYPSGVLPNAHTSAHTSKCNDVSKDVCNNDDIKDFILKDQENLNNEKAPIITSFFEPTRFKNIQPFAQIQLTTNNTLVLPSGNKILLVQLIQSDGSRSDSFMSAVVFSNNAHKYFPINTYVGKYKDLFIGPFSEEQAWFTAKGEIVLGQRNAIPDQQGQHYRVLTFSFKDGIYTLVNEIYYKINPDMMNKFIFEKVGENAVAGYVNY